MNKSAFVEEDPTAFEHWQAAYSWQWQITADSLRRAQ